MMEHTPPSGCSPPSPTSSTYCLHVVHLSKAARNCTRVHPLLDKAPVGMRVAKGVLLGLEVDGPVSFAVGD